MVVCTVTKEGDINNHGYASYWEWQAEFERRRNARYVEPAPQAAPAPVKPKRLHKERKHEDRWRRYEAGWTDAQSAKAEGVETKEIGRWRRAHGLPVNRRGL
jgi:hypothetical protein